MTTSTAPRTVAAPRRAPEASFFPPRRPGVAFAGIALAFLSFALLQNLLIPVLPVMQTELRTDAAGITWALTAWLITAAVATPLLGKVGDLVGKRRTVLVSLVAIGLGSIVAALAQDLTVLVVGRVLQGLGGAVFPLGFGLVRDLFPRERVAGRIGALSAIMGIGAGVGTVLAGPLSELVGWRGLFLIPLAGVLVAGALLVRDRTLESRATGRVNALSALLLSGWLVALLTPLSTGSQLGWGSPFVLGLLGLAAVLFVGWLAVELRSREPLIDLRVMSLPGVWNANLASLLIGAAMFGVFAYFARFVQTPTSTGYGLGASVAESGLLMLPMLVTMSGVGFLVGAINRVVGLRVQLAVAAALIAISTASLALEHGAAWELAAAAGVFGIGLGLAIAATTSIVVQNVPASQTGVATGANANIRTIGSALGTALMTAIVTGSADAAGLPTEVAYQTGFLVLAGLALLASVVALLPSRRRAGATSAGADAAEPTERADETALEEADELALASAVAEA
ncbi:MFS transporter [Agromyces protaetiae]|uniref:MFS transporter n=1 Tax=Agromyces protaetiae TaxID=2509455 RepID=A0A4V0YH07_9MICO|nr:MFS transporter [Agromyces protaetiae]QAY73051.1 MFS transporter [Agromyces protaetiae]